MDKRLYLYIGIILFSLWHSAGHTGVPDVDANNATSCQSCVLSHISSDATNHYNLIPISVCAEYLIPTTDQCHHRQTPRAHFQVRAPPR
ncbi:MAG: hypothetical protein OEZ58_09560 [Gammaproteobacteria bacterium]|nr:hypothetical protein [Gammaproteobacteria bacterium]MDH5729225.1 hypothetical protein [Gammaproteobacteria bacterium]